MALRFAKILAHARPPEKLNVNDPGLTIFSAEDFNVAYSEVHAYRTGLVIEIPEGSMGLLVENNSMGVKGVTVAGGVLTPNNIGEVRVNLINSHREAWEVKAGDPLAWLIILPGIDNSEDEAEEYDREGLTNEMQEVFDSALAESSKLKAERKVKAAQEQAKADEK